MSDSQNPTAFISHATEDKDRFVLEFATRLREAGIDAWVDQWEIRAGDSIVDRVFAHGIESASVFIVVLSATSVNKPWVRDELDAGTIRRITGGTKLIPVLLDAVAVPPALTHLRHVSVPLLGMDGAVQDVRNSVFNISIAPPVAPVPNYTRHAPVLMRNQIDDLVLATAVEMFVENNDQMMDADELLARLPDSGLDVEQIDEAIESLEEQRVIETDTSFAGASIVRLRPNHWLSAMEARGVDVGDIRDKLLVHLVNNDENTVGFDNADGKTIEAIIKVMELEGLATASQQTFGAGIYVDLTVAGKRAAREL